VENAFKHGVGFEESVIDFKLSMMENTLIFTSKNSIVPKLGDYQDSGIGLENVKKRLAILFPDAHILRITSKENDFEVYLSIVLN
jgi:sensor histidine kinase YesM